MRPGSHFNKALLIAAVLASASSGLRWQKAWAQAAPAQDACESPDLKVNPETSYRLLEEDEESLQIRIDLMRRATREIVLTTFIFDNDLTSKQVLALMREAAIERGVKVKVLVDSMFDDIPAATAEYLKRSGVEVRRFNPVTLGTAGRAVRRMHDKYLVVDGIHVILGGRNIQDDYYGLGKHQNFRDRDIYFRNPKLAEQILSYFRDRWDFAWVEEDRPKKPREKEVLDAGLALDEAFTALESHPYAKKDSGVNWSRCRPELPEVEFVHVPVKTGKQEPKVAERMIELIDGAEKSVLIENAYVIPTVQMRHALKRAVKRGVEVRVFTNSVGSNDGVGAAGGHLAGRSWLVRHGIRVWEYYGDDKTLHSKSAVIDGKIAVIGSFNLDSLSQRINAECVAVIHDERVAREVAEATEKRIKDLGLELGKDLKPIGFEERFPGTDRREVVRARLFRIFLVPLIRYFL